MLWLLGKQSGPPESKSRKKLVLSACKCARLALKHVPKGEKRPLGPPLYPRGPGPFSNGPHHYFLKPASRSSPSGSSTSESATTTFEDPSSPEENPTPCYGENGNSYENDYQELPPEQRYERYGIPGLLASFHRSFPVVQDLSAKEGNRVENGIVIVTNLKPFNGS